MKSISLGNNQSLVEIRDYKILFSYETPVVIFVISENMYYVTEKKWSATTSRHINKFLSSYIRNRVVYMSQKFFDEFVGNM